MTRDEIVLAAMAAAPGKSFKPVHVQKLFFLIDKKFEHDLAGAPFFNFQPYDYGPFDAAVYTHLAALEHAGMVETIKEPGCVRTYQLTEAGQAAGSAQLATFAAPVQERLRVLAEYVVSLGFRQLVSAIYSAYPAMKEHSVFNE